MPGILYLVATPIGNLEDITYRAVRTLKEADLIACEDTRQTRKLLDKYGIRRPTVSYHEHNEEARSAELIRKLQEGASVALVSDSGMPLVSDPGYRLVRKAVELGVKVTPVPGPSALITALAASGLATNAFHFGGFLPAKAGQRARALKALENEPATLIFYEAPHRVLETLEEIEKTLGQRLVVIARELTKIHEEFLRGSPGELRTILNSREVIKGEITLLIGKAEARAPEETPLEEAVESHMRSGMSRMEAIKAVAHRRGLSKRQVYQQLLPPDR